jgi:RHH-type proline utilization regulon transcriptional repressor/proline dehydrogenase/delta 1-pyrroline-5-carboxylate dehydrogenase
MRYAPRGVTAVIAPWNFPVAIATGMTSAAIATGNTVVLKPAEQSPGCAGVIAEAFAEAGLPGGVLTLLTGEAEAGRALVEDPRVHQIAFTGSLPVGLGIVETAAKTREGQTHIKRVIAELGGKNCAIVDADADLDDAVPDLMASAFGFAGQKCSAISRVLVHEAIAETLLERLHGAVRTLDVGPAERLGIDVPPVIDEEARDRVRSYAEAAAAHGTVVSAGEVPERGWYVAPTIASALPEDADVLRQEVFGPLLAVTPVPSVAAACDVVDSLPYALTGALFSRNPDVVERVVAASPVGNLYVNRGSTGAMVGRQPFGGNRLSGTGTKAGGPDYLLAFVEPRVVTENTVRHGLVV